MKGPRVTEPKKYPGSHCQLRPAGAEYEIFDEKLKKVAAHSGLPYHQELHL